jgi:hypothetical protein
MSEKVSKVCTVQKEDAEAFGSLIKSNGISLALAVESTDGNHIRFYIYGNRNVIDEVYNSIPCTLSKPSGWKR